MTTPLAPSKPTLDTFGAPYVNANAPDNPTTDFAEQALNRMIAQLVMLGFPAAIAWARCTIAGGVITLADHSAVWGDTTPVKPTAVRTSAGLYAVTWAATNLDMQTVPESHALSIRNASVSGYGAVPLIINRQITSTRQVTVRSWNVSAVATDCSEFEVGIW